MSTPISPGRVTKRRGPISCKECRRLKIKCDRIIPCGPCQRRGCASLCPDGSLVSKGSRYILSDTETLHRKIEELTLRVRELEKGLEDEHRLNSQDIHPLLKEPLRSVAAPPTQEDYEAEAEDGPISTFGTLMIADDGTRMKWLGSTAVAAWFLEDDGDDTTDTQSTAPPEVDDGFLQLCSNFPFGTTPVDEHTKEELYSYLPADEPEAMIIIDRFFLNVGWLYNFVPKTRLESIVQTLYDRNMTQVSSHLLAIFYMVMALNALVDQHPRPNGLSSNAYCQLARAALGVDTIFGANATLATVQALSLLSLWYQLSDESDDPSKSWGCLGLTFKVAQSIGLHRDNRIWNLPEEEAMDRRRVFWELQALDVWQALGYGRPPSLVRPHFDCPQPFDTEESLGHPPHFHRWKHHYVSEGIMNILDQTLISHLQSATSPPHATVLKLDTKIRSCAIPAKLQLKDAGARTQADDMLLLQHYTSMLSKESALMYLHRGFFARAVFDPPHDPLRHKFAHSVLAVYTSASQILKWLREIVVSYHHILARIFGWWGHAYSSAVTLGGLVTMAPGCNLAEQALKEFDTALETLRRGDLGRRARRILPALEKLQQKAHTNFELHRAGRWKPETRKLPPPPEMPGLGTAMLPLTKKPAPSTHSSPPKESPGSTSESQASFDNTPHPYMEVSAAMAQSQQADNRLWALDIRTQESNPMPATISPQDLTHPPTHLHSNTQSASMSSSYGHDANTGRPYSRAQSFDDFLRLHRLQDGTANAPPGPALSAPSATMSLPPYSQHQAYAELPTIHQNDVLVDSQLQENPWGSRQFGHSPWFQFPMYSTHSESSDNSERHHEAMMPPNGMEEVQFSPTAPEHAHAPGQGEYDPAAYNASDMSWQMFMNGLGL